jgi:hypothetical protein
LSIDGVPVILVSSIRNLEIFIDPDLVLRTHVQRTVSRCFAVLRQLRQIRCSVPMTTFQTLLVAWSGLWQWRASWSSSHLVRHLQSVQNAAARLIYNLRRSDHVIDALNNPHWLHIPERIAYKVAILTFKVLHGNAPGYLGPGKRPALLVLATWWCHRSHPSSCLQSAAGRGNDLPDDITSGQSLSIFRRRLKTYLFRRSYPHLIIKLFFPLNLFFVSGPCSNILLTPL